MDPYKDILSSVDEYTSSVLTQFNHQYPCPADPIEQFEEECICSFSIPFNEDNDFDVGTEFIEDASMPTKERHPHSANAFEYSFGNVYQANWSTEFLQPSIRERTYYLSSRDRFGIFRCHFRVPHAKVDDLVSLFVRNGWIYQSKQCLSEKEMYVKAELLILGVMKVLGHHAPFRMLKTDTKISPSQHRSFCHFFIDRMCTVSRLIISNISGKWHNRRKVACL